MFGVKLSQSWLSMCKYGLLLFLVLWIWKSIKSDSREYFGDSNSDVEGFQIPQPLGSSNFLNGFSEKFTGRPEDDLKRFDVASSSQVSLTESDPFDIKGKNLSESQCTSCSASGTTEDGVKLLPVMDPLFNMREICKQCILLEDHLNNKGKFCYDCKIKHELTIEALAEEAISLDKDGKYPFIKDLPDKCREIQKECNKKGVDKCSIAQKYRHIRKALMPLCHDKC